MDTKIDLEHIKSLKEFSREDDGGVAKGHEDYLGKRLFTTSTEDPNIYMVWHHTREGFEAYIVIIGQKSFAFGIEEQLGRSLRKNAPAQIGKGGRKVMVVWIDEILCEIEDYSPAAGGFVHFANQFSFSSSEERDVIVDLLRKLIVAMGEPHANPKIKFDPQILMFTEHAKKLLAAYDK